MEEARQDATALTPHWRSYQLTLMHRYQAEGGGWRPHLRASQASILRFARRVRPKCLAILGSGWTLDVPVAHLLDMGTQLLLVDVAHPTPIRERFAAHPNVGLITCDLTHLPPPRRSLWPCRQRVCVPTLHMLPDVAIFAQEFPEAEAFVSLNLLSQLAEPFRQGCHDALPTFAPNEATAPLQTWHLEWLRATHRPALVITDTRADYLPNKNEPPLASEVSVAVPIEWMEGPEEWLWRFDTQGSFRPGYTTQLLVSAGRIA